MVVFCLVMLIVFNIKTFTDEHDVFVCTILLFVFYGYCVITFSYVTSFIFKEYGNA